MILFNATVLRKVVYTIKYNNGIGGFIKQHFKMFDHLFLYQIQAKLLLKGNVRSWYVRVFRKLHTRRQGIRTASLYSHRVDCS